MPVLAIDQGTSGTKAIVVADDGKLLAEVNRTVRPRYLPDGGVEIDALELWDSVLASAREAIAMAGVTPTAVGLANQGETVVAWDRDSLAPITPAIVWQDRRALSICEALRAEEARIRALSGLELDPYFSAPKMAWIRKTLTTDGVVTTSDTWLIAKMCGAFVTDSSTASRSLIMNVATGEWDIEVAALFSITPSDLPEIVPSDAIVGETNVFGSRMSVVGLIVDQAAALLQHGCTERGMAKCTFGTGAFLLVNCGESDVRSSRGLTTSVAWETATARRFYMDGQVYAAGSALRWLEDVGLLTSTLDLDEEATVDAGGVLCVPSFAGLAAPWWDSQARASLHGLELSTKRGQIVRAVLEGIAAQLAVVVDIIFNDTTVAISELRVDGGLTKSRKLLQAVADVLQIPVIGTPGENTTALGVATLTRGALGLVPVTEGGGTESVEDVVQPLWSAERASLFRAQWLHLIDQGVVNQ